MATTTANTTVALSAESFIDSIGVNVHLWESGSAYTNLSLVETDLAYLGISNLRDQLVLWPQTQVEYTALMALGYKFDFIEEPVLQNISSFVSTIDAFNATYPGSIIAVEGPNEVNLQPVTYNGGSSLANAAEFQQALYAAVQGDSSLSGIPVYNLTMAYLDASQYAQLGNLSGAANDANSHAYLPDSSAPESALSTILPYAQLDAPGLPTVITETGYNTNPADTYSGTDQTVQAKLTLDTLMDAYKSGVAETYLYELFDDASGSWGLFNADGTPKLAATAIHNLTTILNDPGYSSTFIPGSLSYTLTNFTAPYANQLLLEKSSGAFDLVLWAEPQIWNPTTEMEIAASNDIATVTFGQVEGTVFVFDPLVGTTPIASYTNVKQIQIDITDHPIIIEVENNPQTVANSPQTIVVAPSPVIASFSPDSGVVGDGITNAQILTLTGSADANSTLTLFDGTTQIGTTTANSSGAWTFTTGVLANGTHTFTATDADTPGVNSQPSSALNVTVDTVAPNAPVITSDTVVNANEVTLAGTAEANSTVNVFDGTTELGTALASASGAWSFTTSALADGNHAFIATDTDAAGNTSLASQAVDPTIAPPAAPTIASFSPDTGAVGDGITDHAVLTLTGAAQANSTVAVFDGKTELGTATVNSSGVWNFTTATLANGTHSFTTTDTDAAGTSAASSALAVTVDTTPPNPAIANLVHNSNGTVTLSGTSEANSSVSVYDGTTDLGTVTTAANGTWSFTTGKLSTAVHTFTLTAVDVAGNVGSGSNVAIYGPASHETINVGPANDLVTVLGGSDTFAFGTSLGNDVITGFQATGSSHDILQFSHNTFNSFAAVLAHAAQVGSNVVITVDAADTVTLTNVHLSSLQKTDIHIV